MLDSAMKDQLSGIFSGLVSQYVFDIQVAPDHESRQELIDLLGSFVMQRCGWRRTSVYNCKRRYAYRYPVSCST